MICLDQSQLIDKQKAISALTEVVVTYTANEKSSVKLYLCNAGSNQGRISTVESETIANPKEFSEPYRSTEAISSAILQGAKPYTCVVSTFDRN